ncbi:MAG: hypothetical protein ACI9UU_004013 [Candidatus Azotimanducaceae bacterium]|jgi:hypothetical protein
MTLPLVFENDYIAIHIDFNGRWSMFRELTRSQGMRLLLLSVVVVMTACSETPNEQRQSDQQLNEQLNEQPLIVPSTSPVQTSLDLSSDRVAGLEQSLSDSSAEITDADSLLPDMFEDTGDAPRTKLSGKVLTKEEAESMQDSLDGVEFTLEVKTN